MNANKCSRSIKCPGNFDLEETFPRTSFESREIFERASSPARRGPVGVVIKYIFHGGALNKAVAELAVGLPNSRAYRTLMNSHVELRREEVTSSGHECAQEGCTNRSLVRYTRRAGLVRFFSFFFFFHRGDRRPGTHGAPPSRYETGTRRLGVSHPKWTDLPSRLPRAGN